MVIFYLSTKGFNIDWSLRLLDGTLRFFGLALPPRTLFHWDRVVRKLAHVTEFALLTLAFAWLAEAGAVVLPAAPAFYGKPQSIGDLVDFVVDRVLRALDCEPLNKGWAE